MKRKFEIFNEKYNEVQGYLFYDTDTKKFSMQALEDYTGMHPDATFFELWKQGKVEVPQVVVDDWVQMRVITPQRQNIDWILKEAGFEKYDLFELMLYGNGRCNMDYSCIREVECV